MLAKKQIFRSSEGLDTWFLGDLLTPLRCVVLLDYT